MHCRETDQNAKSMFTQNDLALTNKCDKLLMNTTIIPNFTIHYLQGIVLRGVAHKIAGLIQRFKIQ